MSNVLELIDHASRVLDKGGVVFGHGTDNAWDEATALVLGVTGLEDDRANLEAAVSAADRENISALLERRIHERLPLAYLLGRAPYHGLEFVVETGVVIPRSPIAELISARFAPWLAAEPGTVLDLCCGTGCLGIIAALTFPHSEVTLIDLDARALRLASENVHHHGLESRVSVIGSDLFEALAQTRFDLILANPPYVDHTDMATLPAEYTHEGPLGLAGGADGLDLVRRIIDEGLSRLAPGGLLVCEVGRSAPALLKAYPDMAFIWPELGGGGEGVFILPAP